MYRPQSKSRAVLTGVFVMASATQYPHADGTFLKTGEAVVQAALYSNAESDLQKRFTHLAELWKEETYFMSNADGIAAHPAYREIINMGDDAIPLILREMEREPDHWFWALNIIKQFDAVKPHHAGDIEAMTHDWLEWGRAEGVI